MPSSVFRKTFPTDYWTFFCNPRIWEIDRHLSANLETGNYRITPYQRTWFEVGQLGVIRVGIDNRNRKELQGRPKLKPGVYAIIEVIDLPQQTLSDQLQFYLNAPQKAMNPSWRIQYRMVKNLVEAPILFEMLKEDELIQEDPYLVKGFQSATMPLHPLTFRRILELAGVGEA